MHHAKARDYAQRYSVGTLYHEGRERLLLSGLPMVGAYSSACSSSSGLPSSSSHSSYASILPNTKAGLSSLSTSPLNGRHKGPKRPADADVSESDSAPSWDEAVAAAAAGNEKVMGITQLESMDLFAAEIMDDAVPEHEHESAPSSSSMRVKGTQEKERLDRELRNRWCRILDIATAMLSRGPGPGQGVKSSSLGPSRDGSNALSIDVNGQHSASASVPKGKIKKAKDRDNGLSYSSSSCTVAAAQALLDEACAMQPYVNQPGEGLADTVRSTLGELMMVSLKSSAILNNCGTYSIAACQGYFLYRLTESHFIP